MKKRTIAGILITAALLLAACGGKVTNTPTAGQATPTTAAGEPTPTQGANEEMTDYKLTVSLKTDQEGVVEIGDLLYGIFLEDINHAIDGGMYTELIKNRSFEYGSEAQNSNKHGWTRTSSSDALSFETKNGSEDGSCLNSQNPTYAVISNTGDTPEGIFNSGFLSGLYVAGNADYICTFYAKGLEGYTGPVNVSIVSGSNVIAQGTIDAISGEWHKYEIKLTPSEDAVKAKFHVTIGKGSAAFDMISLMPTDTYKGLPVRKDIGEYLEALKPAFLRFPGGCVIEGKGLSTQYSWKDSIGQAMEFVVNGKTTVGDVATRPQSHSIWNGTNTDPYYTTYGIGFYEYFELCEALGCEAVPVLNAGMTCPIQSSNYKVYSVNSAEFKQYVQDALDLVEFCRGGADTKWGKVRIDMGHPEQFPLHYIAIGNEQWQTEYYQHYDLFCEAFDDAAAKNPELFKGVELIIANGPNSGNRNGYNHLEDADDATVDWTKAVDEHYYETANWFFANNTRYDKYSRNLTAKVFLGEYAAKSNSLWAALAEASYMTAIERNADIIDMSCYAPLFANNKANQWTPDLIWFGNNFVYGSVNYYVQKLFAENKGKTYIPAALEQPAASAETLRGKVGLASWQTKVAYDNVKVVSNATGEELYSNNFEAEDAMVGMAAVTGRWNISDGRLVQSNTGAPANETIGDAIYFGDTEWTDYTFTAEGTILDGAEGFLIPVCVKATTDNIFWNIGGWGNTVSCLQIVSGGSKSDQVTGTVKNIKLSHNKAYNIKVVVSGNNIKCYLDDKLYIDYNVEPVLGVYESVNIDSNGDIIIKLVNSQDKDTTISIVLNDVDMSGYEKTASCTALFGENSSVVNTTSTPEAVAPVESTIEVGSTFEFTMEQYSLSIIRIKKK